MDFELALIDMDGTVYSGETPIEGVNAALSFLRGNGVDTLFLTNYAGDARRSYSEKMEKMGIDASSEDVVTSGWLTAGYVSREFPEAEVFVLGEEELRQELREQGLKVAEDCDQPDVLVISNKHDLSYEDLKEVIQGIDDETVMLGTNPDTTIPGENGEIPGAGAFIATVEAMTGRDVEFIGKPSKEAVRTVTSMKDVVPEKCLMVGDNLETDIRMGAENGMETVLVLTGVTERKELEESEVSPDHVIESIAELETVFRE